MLEKKLNYPVLRIVNIYHINKTFNTKQAEKFSKSIEDFIPVYHELNIVNLKKNGFKILKTNRVKNPLEYLPLGMEFPKILVEFDDFEILLGSEMIFPEKSTNPKIYSEYNCIKYKGKDAVNLEAETIKQFFNLMQENNVITESIRQEYSKALENKYEKTIKRIYSVFVKGVNSSETVLTKMTFSQP